jgi:hypothetical protein
MFLDTEEVLGRRSPDLRRASTAVTIVRSVQGTGLGLALLDALQL